MAIVTTVIFMIIAAGCILSLFIWNALDLNYLSYDDEHIAKHQAAKGKKGALAQKVAR